MIIIMIDGGDVYMTDTSLSFLGARSALLVLSLISGNA